MAMQLELTPRQEAGLRREADRSGTNPEQVVLRLIDQTISTSSETEEKRDWTQLFPATGRAVAYVDARLAAEATTDPEAILQAERDLEVLKFNINEERRRSGAERVF